MTFTLLAIGLVILAFGVDLLIKGASSIALRLGLSELLVGLTIVSFGTSAPELAVSIKAGLANQSGIAPGNIIGSNIFNIALILGVTALICPLSVQLKFVRKEMPILIGVSIVFSAILFFQHGINRWWGAALFTGLLFYIYQAFTSERRHKAEIAHFPGAEEPNLKGPWLIQFHESTHLSYLCLP